MRVLLVDDEIELTVMTARFLNARGYSQVETAHSPETAISNIESNKPDVVFLDINLNAPMSGMDVLRRVRKTSPQTRVCMLSAFKDEYEAEAMKLGAVGFLKKPALINDLLTVLSLSEQ
ncbi:MAG: response regulator [Candidatus Omnitrophica bacterium]|nr:response regulator [Candidatus Omnitrophota bacterium]